MLALLVCEDRFCRAAFEAEGSAEALEDITCADCGGPLRAMGYADAEPGNRGPRENPDVRRVA